MEEIFPVGSGVVLGVVVAYLVPARLRGWVVGVFSVLVGAAAEHLVLDDLVEVAIVCDNPKKAKKVLEEF